MVFKGLRDVISFLTVIPVRPPEKVDDVARAAWLFPLAGTVIGIMAAGVGYLLMQFFTPDPALALALFVLFYLTGFHHLDGLLDIGDGLMCRGSHERRLQAMHDRDTGAGGFAAGFFVLLLTFLALRDFPFPLLALVAAETAAKLSMVSALYTGRPSHEGTGSAFSKVVRGNHPVFITALVLSVLISYFFLGAWGLRAVLAALVVGLFMDLLSRRSFGGISGDVLGATNELSRMAALLVMLL
jgi:adenosylcobinamide-GDP ribazoletransferase